MMQQFVRLEDKTHAWKGAWPPPDRLMVAVVRGTDITIMMNAEDLVSSDAALPAADFDVTYWLRVEGKTSQLGDDAPSHLARGAKYVRA